jgi:4-hydroxyacetophenone monooxygenase
MSRRPVIDNDWYEALTWPHVDLVTDDIECLTPEGIQTSDGRTREFDLVVFATGFALSRYLFPVEYTGRDGATLEQLWAADGPRAHLSMTLPGFPNLMTMYGPNGQPRSLSIFSSAEIWTRYAAGAIVHTIERGATSFEPRSEAYEAYNKRLDEANGELIWEFEGDSYYVHDHGRSFVCAPWSYHEHFALLKAFDPVDYIVR